MNGLSIRASHSRPIAQARSKLLNYLSRYVKALGFRQGLSVFAATYLHRRDLYSVPRGAGRIWLRDDPADRAMFRQVFIDGSYDTSGWHQDAWLKQRYDTILAADRRPVIVDAGANIGLASVWFSERFPRAKIYAVEPNAGNLSVLARNATGRPITPLAGAAWDRPARLRIANPDAPSDSFRVIEDERGEGDLQAYGIREICAMEPQGDLFIVKIDIEGGERKLFSSNTAWVKDAALIVMEPHDWLYPGENVTGAFRQCIASLPIDLVIRGENLFSFAAAESQSAGASTA